MTMVVKDMESMTFSAAEQSLNLNNRQFAFIASTMATVLTLCIDKCTYIQPLKLKINLQ